MQNCIVILFYWQRNNWELGANKMIKEHCPNQLKFSLLREQDTAVWRKANDVEVTHFSYPEGKTCSLYSYI